MKLVITIPRIRKNFFSISLIFSLINISLTSVALWIVPGLSDNFRIYALVPLLYTILFALIRRFTVFDSPGVFTIHSVAFLRYMLSPFVMITTNHFSSMCRAYDNIGKAVLIMIVEMVFIFGTMFLYNPKTKEIPRADIKYSFFVKIAAVITFILFVIDNRSLIGNLSVFSGKVQVENTNATLGVVSIIWQALCVFIFCFIIQDISNNSRFRKFVVLPLLCCLGYLLIIFTGQTDLSRWYTIVSLVAIIFWMSKLYPKRRNTIVLMIVVPALLLIIVASILKNTKEGFSGSMQKVLSELINSTNLDSYFAGPANISNAIATKNIYSPGLGSMFFDIFNNFPIINHWFPHSFASVNYFADFMRRGDQILPLVSQSFIWFGYVFTPLLSVFSVILSKKLDTRFKGSDDITTYLYAFFAIWCALMPILNFTIWLSWIYVRIIPAFLLFAFVTGKFSRSARRLRGRHEYQS